MKFALVADIHGNLEALDTVLAAIDKSAPDARLVCAGDVVGYGPDPEACVQRLMEREALCIRGNHEEMVLGTRDFSECIYAGIKSAMWTRKRLSKEAWAFLSDLPNKRKINSDVAVCHGDLDDTATYISNPDRGSAALEQLENHFPSCRLLICAHTHHAAVYSTSKGFQTTSGCETIGLENAELAIINPGAVGQSRDDKPLARYAILDTEANSVTFEEIDYNHDATIKKLRRAGLVPQVVLKRPTGIHERIDWYKTRWARYRAQRTPLRSV